jgi:hypothetical protein
MVRKNGWKKRRVFYPREICQYVPVKHGWTVGEARTKVPTLDGTIPGVVLLEVEVCVNSDRCFSCLLERL